MRSAAWAPGGRWLALGGWDGRVRILESEGGRCVVNMGWASKTVERDTVSDRKVCQFWTLKTGGVARAERVAEGYQGTGHRDV